MTTALLFSLSFCAFAAAATPAEPLHQAAPSSAPEFGAERPVAHVAPNAECVHTWDLVAAPEQIFPLLCPVLEYDWIPTWRAKLIHSESGVAEENCVFETRSSDAGPMIWICTRYQPATYIEYTCFAQRGFTYRLGITLTKMITGTQVAWSQSWHAYNADGEAWIAQWSREHVDAMMAGLREEMEHYLRTGTMLTRAVQ